ncbi:MAG: 30S ribosomal protein S20 [Planctomycetota bacterium]|jgi:small subunit ribosomal protein S20
MAHTLSTAKRIRQNEKRRKRNRAVRSTVSTQTKKVLTAVEKKDRDGAVQALKGACRAIDKAAGKGVLHANTAARKKSRLAASVNALAGGKK